MTYDRMSVFIHLHLEARLFTTSVLATTYYSLFMMYNQLVIRHKIFNGFVWVACGFYFVGFSWFVTTLYIFLIVVTCASVQLKTYLIEDSAIMTYTLRFSLSDFCFYYFRVNKHSFPTIHSFFLFWCINTHLHVYIKLNKWRHRICRLHTTNVIKFHRNCGNCCLIRWMWLKGIWICDVNKNDVNGLSGAFGFYCLSVPIGMRFLHFMCNVLWENVRFITFFVVAILYKGHWEFALRNGIWSTFK